MVDYISFSQALNVKVLKALLVAICSQYSKTELLKRKTTFSIYTKILGHLYSLLFGWILGSIIDVPFTIAKLEGNNWINRIDASNSPINFSEFLGLEIDTLGNLWVADNLYTLLTANSPGWLGITSNIPLEEIDIIPNPSNGIFQVSGQSSEPMQITVLDQQGKQVAQFELNELSSDNSFDLGGQAPGVYFAYVTQGEQQWVKSLVVR
jgi:hypothetical protein